MKRKFTKLTALLLAALMLTALVPIGIGVRADEEGIFTYTVEGGNAQITSCNTDASGNVVIPDKLGGCTVTSIAQNAFANCRNITGVEIPDTVTSIGDSAFANCYGLASVKLPAGLTKIERNTFGYCYNLTAIDIPDGTKEIGELAFNGCYLTEIDLPEGLVSIGEQAFSGARFETVKLPASVKSVECAAFQCLDTLESIIVDEQNTVYYSKNGCLMEKGSDTLIATTKDCIVPDGTKKIATFVFYYAPETEVEIPSSVTHIEDMAFAYSSICSLELPESITHIGANAFVGCKGLVNVDLPSGLEELGAYAFSSCDNLLDVSFGTALVRIGAFAFQNTAFIKNEANWDSGFLYKDTVLIKADSSVVSGNITVKSGTTCIADHAFESCTEIVTVILPSTLKGIGGGTFRNCTNLEKADLSATKIKTLPNCDTQPYVYGTFQNCTNLSEVLLPSTLESIGEGAFRYTNSLGSIRLPDGIREIGANAFSYSTSLYEIELPKSLRIIDSYAFSNCSQLKSIEFPDSLTYVGIDPLYSSGVYKDTSNWEDGVLYNGKYLLESECKTESYTVKDGTVLIARDAFSKYMNSTTSVSLPEGLLYICDSAFYYARLSTVKIPSSVVYIGKNAFYCRGLLTEAVFEDTKVWYNGDVKIDAETVGDASEMAAILGTLGYTDLTKKYLVTFRNYDGEIFSEKEYSYGEAPDYPDEFPTRPDENGYYYFFFGWEGDIWYCTKHQEAIATFAEILKGDHDGDETLSANDAIYLLYNVFFGDEYYIYQDCDYDKNDTVDANDAIYLLYHVFFGEESYPIA